MLVTAFADGSEHIVEVVWGCRGNVVTLYELVRKCEVLGEIIKKTFPLV